MPETNLPDRIFISKTAKEWEKIESQVCTAHCNIHGYLRRRISVLVSQYKSSPESFNIDIDLRKIKKTHYVSPDHYAILSEISAATGVPESTIIDKLIIEPLLRP